MPEICDLGHEILFFFNFSFLPNGMFATAFYASFCVHLYSKSWLQKYWLVWQKSEVLCVEFRRLHWMQRWLYWLSGTNCEWHGAADWGGTCERPRLLGHRSPQGALGRDRNFQSVQSGETCDDSTAQSVGWERVDRGLQWQVNNVN